MNFFSPNAIVIANKLEAENVIVTHEIMIEPILALQQQQNWLKYFIMSTQ